MQLIWNAPFSNFILIALVSSLLAIGIVIDYHIVAIIIAGYMTIWGLTKINRNFYHILIGIVIFRPIVDVWTEYRVAETVGIQMVMTTFIIIAFFLRAVQKKSEINILFFLKTDRIFLFLSLYLIANIISFLFNPFVNFSASISFISRTLALICIYRWAVIEFDNQQKLTHLLVGIIISIVILNGVGLYQIANEIFHTARNVKAIYSTFSHPNMYGNYIIFVSIVCVYFIKTISSNIFKYFLYILLGLNIYLLSQTYSRMGVAVFIIITIGWALQNRQFSMLGLVFITCLAILYYFPNILNSWMIRFETLSQLQSVEDVTSSAEFTAGRSMIFRRLIDLFIENPIIGIGPETFWPYYLPVRPHNEILRNLAEVGLLGFVPFVLYWVSMIKLTVSEYLRNKNLFALMTLYIFLAIILISTTSNVGTKPELIWPMMMIVGAIHNLKNGKFNGC